MTDDRLAIDLARLAADDDLLDRIGRGDPVADAADPIALLAEWRAALPDRPGSGTAADDSMTPPAVSEPSPPYVPHVGTLEPLLSAEQPVPGETTAFLESPVVAPAARPRKSAPPAAKPRSAGRVVRWLAAAAAVIAAGVGVVSLTGGQTGGPSAPTAPAGPNRVAIAAAEQVLGDARGSIERRDLRSARALLDRAGELIDEVRDPVEERRLRAEMERLRALAVEPSPTSTTSTAVTTRPAQAVLPTTSVVPVTAGGPAKPPQVTTTTPSVRTRPGLPTLLPSVIPTFR
ncbi:hypothetical protein SAMN05192558_102333 [Actinokineospora alba]|uniref:Anti-sigma-D factor RsdA to sigma factor binding region n=1 Tax=Actinokineospora alba TaxID=504798 RepID=A0A1H0I0C5_9PSEU|nr:hypothetical protein [Actinokineospora alba]TDP64676.1 hypothetical protein C8E96_0145 [Actinokineospora alba]SDI84283.1 hypothetical protein SAMN05421871_10832 [Actinokineospora alba]SDO24580.1 hypothetical protein SAMN05192558_102333 [Actinokineospora alba]